MVHTWHPPEGSHKNNKKKLATKKYADSKTTNFLFFLYHMQPYKETEDT